MSRHLLRPREKHFIHRRAKRATAIVPTALTGLALWLDLTDLTKLFQDSAGTTPVATNLDPIGKIVDKSTNANNFTQATAGRRPLWQADGNGGLFDSTDDCLTGATTGLLITSKTIVLAWTPVTFPSGTRAVFAGTAGNFYYVGHGSAASSARASWFSATPAQLSQTGSSAFAANTHNTYCTLFDVNGSNVQVMQRVSGRMVNSTAYTDGMPTPTPTGFSLGSLTAVGGSGVNGKIRHALVYNRVLTPLELAGLETYLQPS